MIAAPKPRARALLSHGIRLSMLLFVVGLWLGAPAPLRADGVDSPEVGKLNRRMVELFRQKRYREVIDVALKLYRRTRNPQLFANVGRCYDFLDKDLQALRYYSRFLEATQNDHRVDKSSRELVLQRVVFVRQRLSLTMRELNLVSRPSGAEIWIDGRRLVGLTTPATHWLSFGPHRIELRRAGHRRVAREVVIRAGAALTIDVELPARIIEGRVTLRGPRGAEIFLGERRIGALPLTSIALPVGRNRLRVVFPDRRERQLIVEVPADHPIVVEVPGGTDRTSKPKLPAMKIAGFVLIGVGAALLGGGLGLQIWAKHGDDDANAFVDRHISAGTFDQAALDEYNRRYESVLRRQKGAIALFAIGGASAVAGIVLVALGYAGGKQERQLRGPMSWQPIVLRGGAGMVTEIRF